MVSLLNDPNTPNWEDAALGYFNKGITLRTSQYRLTRYFGEAQPVVELYDHDTDPNENTNIASQHEDVVKELRPLLEQGNLGIY